MAESDFIVSPPAVERPRVQPAPSLPALAHPACCPVIPLHRCLPCNAPQASKRRAGGVCSALDVPLSRPPHGVQVDCLPLLPDTRHFIDAAALAAMKPTGVICNVGRGARLAACGLPLAGSSTGPGFGGRALSGALPAGATIDEAALVQGAGPHLSGQGSSRRCMSVSPPACRGCLIHHAELPGRSLSGPLRWRSRRCHAERMCHVVQR